jgi:hypothetical protein
LGYWLKVLYSVYDQSQEKNFEKRAVEDWVASLKFSNRDYSLVRGQWIWYRGKGWWDTFRLLSYMIQIESLIIIEGAIRDNGSISEG